MVILSRLHNSEDVPVAPTAPERVVSIVGIIKKTHRHTCVAVCEDSARLRRIVAWAGKRHRTNSPIVLFSLTREII